jgi:hypothetical protein
MRNDIVRSAVALTLAALAAACSSPRTLSDAKAPSEVAAPRTSNMSFEDAVRVLAAARAKLYPAGASDPLAEPKSVDDVLAILKSDRIDLFEGGAKRAKAEPSKKGKALAAQLEIAWAEDLRIVANLIDVLLPDLRAERRELDELDAVGKLSPADKKRLDGLVALVEQHEQIVAAASRVALVHLSKGAQLAQALVAEAPDDYEGYRVLADYYRIGGEWDRYDEMVKQVEARHPQSSGLMFLKGLALAEREGDLDGGAKLLSDVVAKDPQFTRAQAQLVFLSRGLTKKREEFLKLKAMNPKHQLVLLAGPVIEAAYESRERRRQRMPKLDFRIP